MSSNLEQYLVKDLALGMYVAQLDRPWTDTPLLFQGFHIQTNLELQQLRECCEYVYVDTGKRDYRYSDKLLRATATKKSFVSECLGENRSPGSEPVAVSLRTVSVPGEARGLRKLFRVAASLPKRAKARILGAANLATPREKLQQAIKKAESAHANARDVLARVINDCRVGGALDIDSIEQAITPVIDSVFQSPDAMACVVRMRAKDQYIFNHALATSIWAVVFGRHLGLDVDNLRALGLGGLLLDIGKTQISDEILQKTEPLNDAEMKEIRRHVDYGVSMLKESGAVDKRVIRMIETHHERYDGSGYPNGLRQNEIPVFGRIAGIVDSYDALTSLRPYAPARSTYHAMRYFLEKADILFQSEMVERFIQVVGIFPTATLIEMNTGEVGIIVEQNHTRRLRPKIMMVLDANKNFLKEFPIIDLAKETEDGETSDDQLYILRGLESGSYGIDPTEYYL